MSYIFDSAEAPDERKRRRQIAEALLLRGTNAEPIRSPWQGAANMAQSLMGGIELGLMDKQDREGRASAAADMAAAMGGRQPAGPSSVAAALSTPSAGSAPVGGFSNAVTRTLGFEGGLNPRDTNGTPSNFGINQQANPDVDVTKLDKNAATALYKSRYWDTIDGDKLAAANPALAHVAFDTSVLAGPGKAQELLAASGGDPKKLLQLREQFQNSLLQSNPEKYGPYAKAWSSRLAGLRSDVGYASPQGAPGATAFAPQGTSVASVLAGGEGTPVLAGGDTLQPSGKPAAAPAVPAGLMGAGQSTSAQQAAIIKALQNPYLSAGQKQALVLTYQNLQKDQKLPLELENLRLDNEAKRRAAGEMETQKGEDGQLYERPKGSNGPWTPTLKMGQKPQNTTFGVVGTDQYGNNKYGFIDPNASSVREYSTAKDPNAPPLPPDAVPPPGVDPKEWRQGYTKNQQAQGSPATPDEVAKLRGEVQGLPSYKNYAQAAPIYRSMFDSAGTNSKASDLNLVYGLGKIMDPGSVVREGEMVMVKNTAGLPEWFTGIVNGLNGGQQLTPETRQAIMKEAYVRLQAYQQQFQQEADFYKNIANKRRADPELVIPNFGQFNPWEPAPKVPAATGPTPAPPAVDPAAIEAEMRRRGLKP